MKLFSIIKGKDCTLKKKKKKKKLRKYSVGFFKAFSKKKIFGGPANLYFATLNICTAKYPPGKARYSKQALFE